MLRKASFSRAALLLLPLLLTVACGPVAESPTTSGGTLVVTNLADVDTVNYLVSNGSSLGRDVERFLFLQLVREFDDFKSGLPSHEPQLAERWELSDDGLALTFFLREARWSDGAPITAEDVRWTFEAQTHPEVAWRLASNKEPIRRVEVVDERTVRFHFAESYPDQLEDANRGAILPRHAWGELPFSEWRSAGTWFAEHAVTSGPFVLERWQPNQEIDLRRNEHYYKEGRPRLDRLVVRIVPEKTSQISQLLGGAVQYVQLISPDQIERIEGSAETEIDTFWARQFDYLCWNTAHPALGNAEVRRALTQAIDRQAIVDSVYRGYARVAVTPVLSTTWAFDETLEPWPYDPVAARDRLSSLGFAKGDDGVLERDGERLSFELLIQSGLTIHLDAATLIQAHLARAGVELVLRPVEFQSWVDAVIGHDFEVVIGGWNIPSSLDMSFAFHTDEIGKYNFGAYSNLALDRLLEVSKRTENLEEKRSLLQEIQAILHADQPYTFLWEPQQLNGRSRRLRETRPNALTSFFNVDEWWLEPN